MRGMENTKTQYENKAALINAKFPNVKARVQTSKFGGRLEIEVAKTDYAKALCEMYHGFTFTCGVYK